jgi:hypothetical protein
VSETPTSEFPQAPAADEVVVEDEPGPMAGLRLGESEQAVLRELTERERDTPAPRLASSYRRLLELSRSNDQVDAVLAAHLARELLSALPGALGVEIPRGRLEYENLVGGLARTWPAEVRSSDPPPQTVVQLRRLLDEHDQASGRARHGPRELLSREDRARTGYVPDISVDRWTELVHRGSALAHRLRNLDRELPDASEVRRLVDELTDTLLATITPYFIGIGEIDRLLAIDHPSDQDAARIAALLRTPSQYIYFFERAHELWLRPLANIPGTFRTPPRLIDVGGGYVQAPFWPQGRFLARVASSDPRLVAEIVERIPATDNPRAIAEILEIARELPSDIAAGLVPRIAPRMSVPLAIDYAAIDAAKLVQRLAEAGFGAAATRLLMAAVAAALASPRDERWHLDQLMAAPVDAVAAVTSEIGTRLRACLRRRVRRLGPIRRRHSTLWLRSIDLRPRYAADPEWFIANALYRVLLLASLDAARTLVAGLISDRDAVLQRVAFAAIAERPELAPSSDSVLMDVGRWDDDSSSRYEFRRALAALWSGASDTGHQALLDYAAAAAEADEINHRLAANQIEHDPDGVRRRWRSRLLYRVREQLPQDWLDRHGPLDEIEDDRLPEPTAARVGSTSPFSEDELAELSPADLLARLQAWSPPQERTFERPTFEGLGRTAAAVVLRRLPEFATLAADFAQLPVVITARVTSAIERHLREGQEDDRRYAAQFMLDLADALLGRRGAGHAAVSDDLDMWSREVKRDIAGTLSQAANKELLGETESERALRLLAVLLRDPDPTPESDTRDADGGYDAGMLALNSVRGEATTAMIELLLTSRRNGRTSLVEAVSAALRNAVATDLSRSVRAAIGIRLPWLLGNDQAHEAEWLTLLFGEDVPAVARAATWQGYLLYSRFFAREVALLAAQYDLAVSTHVPRPEDERGRTRDEDEHLGIHVALAHLIGLEAEARGDWLAQFFGRAAGWVRARVTRWIAEQAADDEAKPEIRARARDFLKNRVAGADPATDAEELKAVSWIASATEATDEILDQILLPALEKTGGTTENESGAVALAARTSTNWPRSSARLVQLLVEGDQWHSLPHVASAELRQALERLISSGDAEARRIAVDVVNTLGAQGFLEFRPLIED